MRSIRAVQRAKRSHFINLLSCSAINETLPNNGFSICKRFSGFHESCRASTHFVVLHLSLLFAVASENKMLFFHSFLFALCHCVNDNGMITSWEYNLHISRMELIGVESRKKESRRSPKIKSYCSKNGVFISIHQQSDDNSNCAFIPNRKHSFRGLKVVYIVV